MSEEEKKKEEPKPAEDTGEGDKPKAASIVEQANLAAEGLAKENARMEENLKRQEEFKARELLSGQTTGPQPEEKKEQTPKEYAEQVDKGLIPEK